MQIILKSENFSLIFGQVEEKYVSYCHQENWRNTPNLAGVYSHSDNLSPILIVLGGVRTVKNSYYLSSPWEGNIVIFWICDLQ